MESVQSKGVALPTDLTDADREILAAMAHLLAGARRGSARPRAELVRELERAGWEVSWHPAWVADARKPGIHEQAVGRTVDEALERIWDMTLVDDVEGCP